MPRYYGPGYSRTESAAMKELTKQERKEKQKSRVQVWRAPEEPHESLRRFVERMDKHDTYDNGNHSSDRNGDMRDGVLLHRQDPRDRMGE